MQRTKRINSFLATAVSPRHRQGRLRIGFELMRDKKTPIHVKFLALTFAVCITILLIAFEVPLEGLLAIVMPLFGVPADLAVDGIEVVMLPAMLTMLLLPSLVKRTV